MALSQDGCAPRARAASSLSAVQCSVDRRTGTPRSLYCLRTGKAECLTLARLAKSLRGWWWRTNASHPKSSTSLASRSTHLPSSRTDSAGGAWLGGGMWCPLVVAAGLVRLDHARGRPGGARRPPLAETARWSVASGDSKPGGATVGAAGVDRCRALRATGSAGGGEPAPSSEDGGLGASGAEEGSPPARGLEEGSTDDLLSLPWSAGDLARSRAWPSPNFNIILSLGATAPPQDLCPTGLGLGAALGPRQCSWGCGRWESGARVPASALVSGAEEGSASARGLEEGGTGSSAPPWSAGARAHSPELPAPAPPGPPPCSHPGTGRLPSRASGPARSKTQAVSVALSKGEGEMVPG